MATLSECIERYHAALATRDPSRPIRLIRVAVLPTARWRQMSKRAKPAHTVAFASGRTVTFTDRDAAVDAALAATGEHLGLELVGLARRSGVRR